MTHPLAAEAHDAGEGCEAAPNPADAFARDLTELSQRYGVAISGSPELFLMEADDFALNYICDGESRIRLA